MRWKLLGLSVLSLLGTIAILEGIFFLLNKSDLRQKAHAYVFGRELEKVPPLEHKWSTSLDTRKVIQENPPPFQIPRQLPIQGFDKPFYRWNEGLLGANPGEYLAWATSPESGRELYRAAYTVGQDGYRVTPDQGSARKYALFLGDSFVFGIGVNDRETLPYHFRRRSPEYRAYNHGFGGYGPNDLLVRIRREAQIPVREKSGVIFYFYYADHAARLLGGMQYLGLWGADHPYLVEREKGIAHEGSFREALPIRVGLAWLWARSQFTNFFHLDWPVRLHSEQAKFLAKVIQALKAEYETRLPGARFVFVVAPGEGRDAARILPELDRLGIETLDYSGFRLEKYVRGLRRIPGDGHHTAEANQVLADQLARDLSLMD